MTLKLKIIFIIAVQFGLANLIFAQNYWSQNKFLIGGFGIGQYPLVNRDSNYIYINNADIDIVVNSDVFDLASCITFTNKLSNLNNQNPMNFDLKGIVKYEGYPPASDRIYGNDKILQNDSAIRQRLSLSGGIYNSRIEGWIVWDEPRGSQFDSVGMMSSIIHDVHPTFLAYTNLNPVYGFNNETEYRNYLDQFLFLFNSNFPPPILSVDHYPFCNDSIRTDYYLNLKIIQEKAAKFSSSNYRIPFWFIIQLSAMPDIKLIGPSISQIRWQAYSALAYGAKGIFYWTLVPNTGWGTLAGILDANGYPTPKYNEIKQLNNQLHKLGPCLMNLDPIVVYHSGNSDNQRGINDYLLSNPKKVYNIVASVTNSNGTTTDYAVIGYLKEHNSGSDYLLVVNKDFNTTRTFKVNLTNKADSIFKVQTTDSIVGLNKNWFIAGPLLAGEGMLYKIVDSVYEYIPNVNIIKKASDGKMFYGHNKGIVMVDYQTGHREYFNDWGAYTPVVDMEIDNVDLYVCQNNGNNGNLIKLNTNLEYLNYIWQDGAVSTPVTSVAVSLDKVFVGQNWHNSLGNVVVLDKSTWSLKYVVAQNHPVNDVKYQLATNSFLVAHNTGILRYTADSVFVGAWKNGDANTPVVDMEIVNDTIYAALDDGNAGEIIKIHSSLWPNLGLWDDCGAHPRILDIALNPNKTRMLVTTIKPNTFQRFRLIDKPDFTPITHINALFPRTSFCDTNFVYMADSLGVRRGGYDLKLKKILNENSINIDVPLAIQLRQNYPNPFNPETHIDFVITKGTHVNLQIFDILGRSVASLIDSYLDSGEHHINWNASNYAAGIYFYRLTAGILTETKKLLLLK